MSIPEREAWERYEREKRELQLKELEPDEYEEACQKLAASLGI